MNLYGFVGARPHEKTDPLGLGRLGLRRGCTTTENEGEAAKEDIRYLAWLASSPASIVGDYGQRREFLEHCWRSRRSRYSARGV